MVAHREGVARGPGTAVGGPWRWHPLPGEDEEDAVLHRDGGALLLAARRPVVTAAEGLSHGGGHLCPPPPPPPLTPCAPVPHLLVLATTSNASPSSAPWGTSRVTVNTTCGTGHPRVTPNPSAPEGWGGRGDAGDTPPTSAPGWKMGWLTEQRVLRHDPTAGFELHCSDTDLLED